MTGQGNLKILCYNLVSFAVIVCSVPVQWSKDFIKCRDESFAKVNNVFNLKLFGFCSLFWIFTVKVFSTNKFCFEVSTQEVPNSEKK